jgi:hypothetical protein
LGALIFSVHLWGFDAKKTRLAYDDREGNSFYIEDFFAVVLIKCDDRRYITDEAIFLQPAPHCAYGQV